MNSCLSKILAVIFCGCLGGAEKKVSREQSVNNTVEMNLVERSESCDRALSEFHFSSDEDDRALSKFKSFDDRFVSSTDSIDLAISSGAFKPIWWQEYKASHEQALIDVLNHAAGRAQVRYV